MSYMPQGFGDAFDASGFAPNNRRHFRAGASAAWAKRWDFDLDRAESDYERRHNLSPFSDAARAFSAGWAWSASN